MLFINYKIRKAWYLKVEKSDQIHAPTNGQ